MAVPVRCRGMANRLVTLTMSVADQHQEDEDIEPVPIPMGSGTRRRLVRFASAIGKPPAQAAGDLLKDLLADSDFWDAAELVPEKPALNS